MFHFVRTSLPKSRSQAAGGRSLAAGLAVLALVGCGGSSHSGDSPPLPSKLLAVSATRQTGRAGEAVGSTPAVKVVDADGKAVAGVEVRFAAGGGGSVGPASVVTGADGMARTSWRLGGAGEQSVQATSPAMSGAGLGLWAEILPSSGYHVDLRLMTEATDAQWGAFTAASARIAQVIVGGVAPVDLSSGVYCEGKLVTGPATELLILVQLKSIDGEGGILGQAGPCAVRQSGDLPAVGVMEFDTADLDRLQDQGKLGSVILHEMLHVVGFGTEWGSSALGLLSGAGTVDSAFVGPEALAAAKLSNHADATWTSVPAENCGPGSPGYPDPTKCGGGTRDSHWREATFMNELMTGWLSGATQPLSATTIGSLADLGYTVDPAAADPFDLATAALRGEALAPDAPGETLGDDVLVLPLTVVP